MAFSGSALLQLAAELTSPLDLSTPTSRFSRALQINLTEGTGAGQANRVWHDQRTLAASATENLDLAGTLNDPFGQPITFARIKLVYVQAAASNVNDVQVSRPASGVPLFLAASDGIVVRPGGVLLWAAPDATGVVVTPTSADLLAVTNGAAGSSVTYDVLVIGAAT